MKKHGPASVVAILAILVASFSAAPASAATWYLPGASETPGQNGAYYSSTLWVTNTGTSPASVEFRFIPFAGMAAASPVVRTLQAGETREYERVLPTLFTLERGAGTIVLVTDGSIVATMSTANTADPKGTFGLAVRPVAESELAGAGSRHEVVFASHKADLKTASRTNVSAVLVDPNTSFTVVVYDPAGTELGRKTVSSATPVHWQESLGPIVGDRDVPLGRVSFEVASGRIAVYDSVVDNVTNDGFVIQGVPSTRARGEWLLAGMSRAPGEKGTFWTSDVWVHNPQTTAIQVTFTPWIAGAAPFTRSVGAKGILQIADIVGAGGFGLERGSGVVEVRSDSPFFVESRTYNSDPANPASGTYSATVRAFTDDLLVRGPGQAAVNAAEASDAFRTNLTLFSPTGGTLALKLLDQQGTEISRATATLGAKTSWQQSLAGWFSSGSNSVGTLSIPAGFKGTVVVDVPAGVLFQGYVSRVDNGTGDGMAPAFTPIQTCAPPAITSFTATPSSSTAGAPVTLTLASTGCVSAKVTPGDLPIPCNGSITVTPTETREYTATATGACAPAATAKTTVNVGCPEISVTVDAQGPTDFCSGSSVTLVANATNCASCTYTWSRYGRAFTTGRSLEASDQGSYTVEAKDAAGCTATSSPVEVGVYDTPTATVGGSASVCAGGSATLTASFSGVPPFDGQWSDGTPFHTNAFSLQRAVSPAATTTYSISSFGDAHCIGSATGSATVTVNPNVDATITAPATVAGGSTGNTASVPSAGAGATYAWTITNGTITSGQGTASITFTAGSTGTVSLGVTVTSAANCSESGSKSVGVDCTPPSATITAPASVCANATAQAASVPDAGAGATYAWTITNGTITGGAGTRAITWDAGATGPVQLSVTVTAGASCSNAGNASVTVNPNVSGSISANPTTINGGETSNLTITVANGTSWSLSSALGNHFSPASGVGSGTFSSVYNADNAPGLDTVTLTIIGACGSPKTYTVQITVCEPPTAIITAPASVCPASTGNAASVPSAGAGATYAWTITNGTITAGSGTNAITWTAGAIGPVQLSVTVTNGAGCSDTGNASVTVNPNPTISSLTVAPGTIALGGTATVTFTISNATSWSLASSIGNGFAPASGTGNGTISVTYSAANFDGTDTITLTATNGCGSTQSTTTVVVSECSPPTATITPAGPTTFCEGGSVTLTASAGSSFLWNNGATTQSITVAASGSYSVVVTNAAGCQDTSDPVAVTVTPAPTATITPAGPTTFCEGGGVTLQGPAGMSAYVWYKNGSPLGATTPNVAVGSAGSYTVLVTNASGCQDMSDPVVVTVNPLPVGGALSASPTTITENGSSTLTFTCTNCTSVTFTSSPGNSISAPIQINATTWQATFTDSQGANSYTISASGSNSCGSSNATNTATIEVTF